MARKTIQYFDDQRIIDQSDGYSDKDRVNAFYKRQQYDLRRLAEYSSGEVRRRHFPAQNGRHHEEEDASDQSRGSVEPDTGGESWQNSEGDRLGDFGVDEDVEFYDEDEVPLAELLRRRKANTTQVQDGHD